MRKKWGIWLSISASRISPYLSKYSTPRLSSRISRSLCAQRYATHSLLHSPWPAEVQIHMALLVIEESCGNSTYLGRGDSWTHIHSWCFPPNPAYKIHNILRLNFVLFAETSEGTDSVQGLRLGC